MRPGKATDQLTMMKGYRLTAAIRKKFLKTTITLCLSLCQLQTEFFCMSVSFNHPSGTCSLHSENKLSASLALEESDEYWERTAGGKSHFSNCFVNNTVSTFNSCTKCVDSPCIIHNDCTPICHPVSWTSVHG